LEELRQADVKDHLKISCVQQFWKKYESNSRVVEFQIETRLCNSYVCILGKIWFQL
jgi:hypothetical protein